MSGKLKVGVVGVGALGQHHARLYADLRGSEPMEFVGIYDANPDQARKVAEKHGVQYFETLDALVEACEAASIVTPTVTHFEIARQLLDAGRHVLIEKPITYEADQAETLIALAQANSCLLQVGHVERFNPVFDYLQRFSTQPRFIEAHRLSPYPARSMDIGVVMDLMIHDLDLVLAFVRAQVEAVDAVGIPVLSGSEDIANARLRFSNGCIANITASRISPERMRKIRVFSGAPSPCYISLDYRGQEGFIYRLAEENDRESSLWQKLWHAKDSAIVSEFGGKKIVREPVPIEKDEPLKLELKSFIQCVANHQNPVVSGESAKQALEIALEITRQINRNKG